MNLGIDRTQFVGYFCPKTTKAGLGRTDSDNLHKKQKSKTILEDVVTKHGSENSR